ncbi:acyl-CoA thioesterase [bacterium]|nr:acyl-CoA thioesterase [bacterium]
MPSEFSVRRRIEFSETDMAGIVHFSNFFRYMETVEHAFYRSLGFSVVHDQHNPPIGFPRVHASCDYSKPLRFEDEIEIRLRVIEKKDKALTHQILFYKLAGERTMEVARGKLVVVCVTKGTDGRMAAVPIPKDIADKIEIMEPEPPLARG